MPFYTLNVKIERLLFVPYCAIFISHILFIKA